MQQHPFTARQVFNLKRKTLEKRIPIFYKFSGDKDSVIKLVRALQIRDTLVVEDFEKPCLDLVRFLYMSSATATMKRYIFYFSSYFTKAEWAELLLRLFSEVPRNLVQQRIFLVIYYKLVQQFVIP